LEQLLTITNAPHRRLIVGGILTRPSQRIWFAAVLVFALSCADSSAPEYTGPYKHVLLITMDTTRADHLGCYEPGCELTPNIDALAADGVRFEHATSAAPSTLASHTSLMTGLYPRRHGVARNGFMVNQENVLLAEVLGQAGFHCAGCIGSFALDEMFDFNQGFEFWDQEFQIDFDVEHADQNQRRAQAVTDAVLAHVDRVGSSQRLFLFAHYFDVHAPYDAPESFASRYALAGGLQSSTLGDIKAQETLHQERIGERRAVFDVGLNRALAKGDDGSALPGDEELAALYSAEVAYTDFHIGRLLDGLEQRGILQDCIVILTADHGETFWEHGDFWHHGVWVYETNVHVPFIIRLPDGRGRGTLVKQPVSGTDLFPTLLDLLGIALPEELDGISLVPAIDGLGAPLRPIFSEATQPTRVTESESPWVNQQKSKCIRLGRWKLIRAPYIGFQEFYDLASDPGERHNLLMSEPTPQARAAYKKLSGLLDGWAKSVNPRASRFNPEQMDSVLARLQALGYVGAEGDEKGSEEQR